jgi:YVTN family beta-propeller protein
MSFRRVGGLVATALATLLWMSCGDVYRPVVIPVSSTPPNPSGFHAIFALSTNAPFNPGTAMQIDVSGDSTIGQANMGVNPTHAAALPNNSRVFVASSGSLFTGDSDAVVSFVPASDSALAAGLGNPITISLPFGSLPVFVATSQSSMVFVANYGTNTVSGLATSTNSVTLNGSTGVHPIALAETPDAQHLYVLNQGDNTVSDLSPVDLSTRATIPVGITPTWAVTRPDSRRLYVVTQGDGQLYTLDSATNAQVAGSPQSVGGAGANFIVYDSSRSRLYVTNPASSSVYVFDATTDPPTPLGGTSGAVSIPAPSPCAITGTTCSPVAPTSVAALPDGSRFYVASSVIASPCPDVNVGNTTAAGSCLIPQLTVFNAASLTIKPVSSSLSLLSPSLSLLAAPRFAGTQYAVPQVSTCAPAGLYSPSSTRFRMSAAAAADSSHVYAAICDAGVVADISTTTSSISTGGTNTPDKLATDITAPFAGCGGSACPLVADITALSIASNVVTFTAANNFVPGQQVQVSGLSSKSGAPLDGQTLTVLATGLSGSAFQCILTGQNPDVGQTSDTGTAVPVPTPQTPIYLLSGT